MAVEKSLYERTNYVFVTTADNILRTSCFDICFPSWNCQKRTYGHVWTLYCSHSGLGQWFVLFFIYMLL